MEQALDITRNDAKSRYELQQDGETAVADYLRQGERLVITHVGVPKALENRGIGSALVKFALEEARKARLRVVPLCSFAEAYIRRHKEYQDLL